MVYSILTPRQPTHYTLSPAHLEFQIKQHEKVKPESGSDDMNHWLAEYNRLQGQLHRARH